MSRSYRLTVPVVLFAVAAVYLWPGPSSPAQEKGKGAEPPVVRWEYKVLNPSPVRDTKALEKSLNDLGADGWEVVGAVGTVHGGGNGQNVYTEAGVILKRRK